MVEHPEGGEYSALAIIDESPLAAAEIRDQPINASLRRVLIAAARDADVDVVRVVSGGQPGSTGRRIGSRRHDGGNAADVELVRRGRRLDFTSPGDLATVSRFVAAAASHGAIGIGAGVGYMGPTRLHVGFGNGPDDMTFVVWGAGGLAANAPEWLRLAAAQGWGYAPAPTAPTPIEVEPASAGDAPVPDPGALPPRSGGEAVGRLESLLGALYALAGGPVATRVATALFQFLNRLPATGVADADTWAALARWAPWFRRGGWLLGAFGVAGLVRSVGGASLDSQLQTLDGFRDMLGKSSDPAFVQAIDGLRQVAEAAKPAIEAAARTPPWDALLALLGAILPGPGWSLAAAGLGILLHGLGAGVQRRVAG